MLHESPGSPDELSRRLTAADDVAALDDALTAGYGEVLALEAQRTATAREIDALLEAGQVVTATELIRAKRMLAEEIARRRELLRAARWSRAAGRPPRDP